MAAAAMQRHFRKQAATCAAMGSPFTAHVLTLAADRLSGADAVNRKLRDWPEDRLRDDAVALRLAGGELARS